MPKIFIVLIFILLLAGCRDAMNGPDTPLPPLAQLYFTEPPEQFYAPVIQELSAPQPRTGGTLNLSMRAPATLNPLLNEDATVARVLQLMFEPLIAFDDELRPVPHLASLEFAFNGASVVATIQNGARWSDGSPITSDDLIFSIETLRNAGENAVYRRNVENFAQMEALDERSVRITFSTITGGAAYLFNFPIIPRHHFQQDINSLSPAGSGPFMFNSFTESLSLVRNPYSFRGRPNIQDVYVIITSDAETDLHAFDRGLADIYLSEVPAWARHHSVKPVRSAEHFAMHYEFIGFNFARPLPSMHQFRRAVAHALNVEEYIPDVFLTHAMAARSPIHPASWLYEPDVFIYEYDLDAARALAGQVRHTAAREGLWPLDDEDAELPLTVLVNRDNIEGVQIARTITEQMNAIGLKAELLPLPFEDYLRHLQNGYFDLFVGGYKLSLHPNLSFAFHSESPENILSYNDPELDRLLEAAAVAGTDSQFQRTVSDIQMHLARQLPVISLAFRHSAVIADRRIYGDIRPAPDNIFANVHEWFILAAYYGY
jgi:peptide/nickel transport system substrate-binding protein